MKHIGQNRIEWGLLGVIGVVCLVLSFLQYRWTGELSRAEPVLLRAGLNEQIRRLVQSFNEELRENCTALLPVEQEIAQRGFAPAHEARYKQWATSHDRSFFSRVGIASPGQGTLKLYGIDSDGHVAPMPWPEAWEKLRTSMTARMNREGRPPNAPLDSRLIELPVFAGSAAPLSEVEWMIFEVNEDYLRTAVLPRLAAEYLNPGRDAVYDVSVNWDQPPKGVIFSTRSDGRSVSSGADASAGIFTSDLGTGPANVRGRIRGERLATRWTIAVRHREGSIEAVVSRARWRNLIASLILVGLLGGAAWALVRYTARSRRLSEMQFRFAAGVSHDLRTPLTAIRGAAFNLAEGLVSEPTAVRRYLKLILRNAEELTSMIENVLAFSAATQTNQKNRHETIAVGDLVQRAAITMTREVEQAGLHIETNIAPQLPLVEGDPLALELVFRNLIGNAVRHGAGGKWIGVSASACDAGVEVRISDRGPGISEGESERIFEPFFRGERTRAQHVPGTGLGLSLAKNTVDRHKGTIRVDNAPGGGAQFTVHLPSVPQPV